MFYIFGCLLAAFLHINFKIHHFFYKNSKNQ
jgi:hypothetical protein